MVVGECWWAKVSKVTGGSSCNHLTSQLRGQRIAAAWGSMAPKGGFGTGNRMYSSIPAKQFQREEAKLRPTIVDVLFALLKHFTPTV